MPRHLKKVPPEMIFWSPTKLGHTVTAAFPEIQEDRIYPSRKTSDVYTLKIRNIKHSETKFPSLSDNCALSENHFFFCTIVLLYYIINTKGRVYGMELYRRPADLRTIGGTDAAKDCIRQIPARGTVAVGPGNGGGCGRESKHHAEGHVGAGTKRACVCPTHQRAVCDAR